MRIKKEIPTIVCLSLVITFIFVAFSFTSHETEVCVDPTEKIVYLYDNFTINVNITGVVNLYSYDIKLYYNTITVDGLSVDLPPGHFMEPINNPAKLIILHKEIDDNYNATHGRVWVSVRLLTELYDTELTYPCEVRRMRALSSPGRSGSGIIFRIAFHCTGVGTSVLDLYETQLINYEGSSISHVRINGLINVHC